ncbi:MAG: adenylate/guanylate cyclase protein [Pseudobdellovibrio sp.]|jgi:class 3 adenylate cyclase|nr:adenylate/guanylate cyclase protein [Pseudobdellovibrio sp.]
MLTLENFKNKLLKEGSVKWKSHYDVESFWSFEIKGTAEEIWAYISDTSRFNREAGFLGRDKKEIDGESEVTTTMVGFEQIWIEKPWTWIFAKTISSVRIYKKGMAEAVHSVFHIEPVAEKNFCRVYIYFGWDVKNLFWKFFISATSPVVKGKFAANFKKIEDYLAGHKGDVSGRALKGKPPVFSDGQSARLLELTHKLAKKTGQAAIATKLSQFIQTGDDFELESIRALKLAKEWNENPKDVIVTCLHATRLGLLNISWNVVCPHCRGPRFTAESLGDIPTQSSCGSCNLEFTTAEPDVIEIVFKVNKSVRDVPEIMYCAAEPAKKSHIKIHQVIEPGQAFEFKADFPDGFYRARVANTPYSMVYRIDEDAEDVTANVFESDLAEQPPIGPSSVLVLKNNSSAPLDFSFEELQWNKFILRPAQLFLIPEFKDLFSSEHLNSAVRLDLGEQTILFTDIVGSTKFYERVGDAKAFAEVRAHFQEIFSEVKKHDGAVVKTIGDAVMASFPSLENAFDAACAIQKRFPEGREDLSIRVRISVHKGSVIAVQLNTGVDYFGKVVNSGAKIQALAGAGEIAIATELHEQLKDKYPQYPAQERTDRRADFGFPVRVISVS